MNYKFAYIINQDIDMHLYIWFWFVLADSIIKCWVITNTCIKCLLDFIKYNVYIRCILCLAQYYLYFTMMVQIQITFVCASKVLVTHVGVFWYNIFIHYYMIDKHSFNQIVSINIDVFVIYYWSVLWLQLSIQIHYLDLFDFAIKQWFGRILFVFMPLCLRSIC